MNETLKLLIEISHQVGKDNSLVQGSGGNTSIKSDDGSFMYIKASGTSLQDMDEHKGWRCLKLAEVLGILKDKNLFMMPVSERELEVVKRLQLSCMDGLSTNARPSVESHLHAFLDRVVIHTHPLVVLPFVCSRKGEEILNGLFNQQDKPILWIPYADPGYGLAQKMSEMVSKYKSKFTKTPVIIFLQKHGLVVSGQSAEETLKQVHQVVRICQNRIQDVVIPKFSRPKETDILHLTELLANVIREIIKCDIIVRHFLDDEIIKFISDVSASTLASYPAVVPEELAYSNGPAVWMWRIPRIRDNIDSGNTRSRCQLT